jgi:hypothetical protein
MVKRTHRAAVDSGGRRPDSTFISVFGILDSRVSKDCYWSFVNSSPFLFLWFNSTGVHASIFSYTHTLISSSMSAPFLSSPAFLVSSTCSRSSNTPSSTLLKPRLIFQASPPSSALTRLLMQMLKFNSVRAAEITQKDVKTCRASVFEFSFLVLSPSPFSPPTSTPMCLECCPC